MNDLAEMFALEPGLATPPYYEAILEVSELSDDPRESATSFIDFAILLTQQGRPDAAEPLLRESVRILKNLPRENRVFTAYAVAQLGECLMTLERFEEAEPLLIESLAEFQAELTDIHPSTVGTRKRIVKLYETWQRPNRAAAYRSNSENS